MIGVPELIAADEEHPLAPKDFDRASALRTFTALAHDVRQRFPDALWELREDTAFHGQIGIGDSSGLSVIRASNFGRLITIFPMFGRPMGDMIHFLCELFDKHHYVFVEAAVLQNQYGGLCRERYATWVDRFFGSK